MKLFITPAPAASVSIGAEAFVEHFRHHIDGPPKLGGFALFAAEPWLWAHVEMALALGFAEQAMHVAQDAVDVLGVLSGEGVCVAPSGGALGELHGPHVSGGRGVVVGVMAHHVLL
jgi:hypothetical protein